MMRVNDIKRVNEKMRAALKKGALVFPAAPKGTAHASKMRRFVLQRHEDVSGTSGTGVVAEGCVFTSGHVVLTWLSPLWSHEVCLSMEAMPAIHGHSGKTQVVWVDPAVAP